MIVIGVTSNGCANTEVPSSADRTSVVSSAPSVPTSTRSGQLVPPARRADSVPVAQPPRTVSLPSGRTVAIRPVGTTTAGLLDVPADVDNAGWWRGGAHLGDPFGSILVAAHVDSRSQGLGPFAELLTAARGTRVVLESAGLRQVFVIRSRLLVPQGSLADDSWIFGATGDARLTLVTCAPPYDASRGGYQNLAVVTAVPLSDAERR